tara:strand:- start:174 stop:839 length:666 start_codon:yes stop_codon:yes gene_type:complete
MKVIWNDDKRALRTHECLSALSIYHAYKQAGENYLEEVDVARTGYVVRRDIRNTTPSSVFEVFTELYQSLVSDIDGLYNDRDGMRQRMQDGSWDPIDELMNDSRMKNAIGVFLQRKHMIVNRMPEAKSYDKARDELPSAIEDMKGFIGAFLSDASQTLVTAISRHGFKDGKDISALKPRVLGLDFSGLVVRIDVDEEIIMLNEEKEKVKEEKTSSFDPSYG